MASKPHPYIPNSVPEVKAEMLRVIGAASAEELYADMIPDRLLLKRRMNLPEPLPAEHDLKKHVAGILDKNKTCDERSASSVADVGITSFRRSATK